MFTEQQYLSLNFSFWQIKSYNWNEYLEESVNLEIYRSCATNFAEERIISDVFSAVTDFVATVEYA